MNALAAAVMAITPASATAPAEAVAPGSSEAALALVDAKQKELVARADVEELAKLSAPELTINAPTNRILTRDQFFAMMRSGQIGAEAFELRTESITISGDVGIVMGSEVFTPTAGSELGRTYGAVPLKRRYTNVYSMDHGQWRWLARHANVLPDQRAPVTK